MFYTTNVIQSRPFVTTSFIAVYLTFCQNTYYAHAVNDILLIFLRSLTVMKREILT